MITKLTLKNFKNVGEQSYEFTSFDLFLGWNNSGKSTVLQALAIWQYCVDEFKRSNRKGSKGIQVILPNFTALPVPVFNLLWRNKKDREYPEQHGKRQQKYILIEIDVTWIGKDGQEHTFGVALRYQSAQTIYAIPQPGWRDLRSLEVDEIGLPSIAYVPPFSGLEPQEERRDDAPLRRQIGKAQPGSVLRNLLLRVSSSSTEIAKESRIVPHDWEEIASVVKRWFSVELQKPRYVEGKDTAITCEYKQGDETFDIISGGSGFHQALTLLAFLYGYHPDTILLDEPDAHLHVNLQREILDYFKLKSQERGVQFLIATHAEEFAKGVSSGQIISLLGQKPHRFPTSEAVLRAMADLSNTDVAQLRDTETPVIVYVEGETDERIIRAWAPKVGADAWIHRLVFHPMCGGTKQHMRKAVQLHFEALAVVIPEVKRVMIFDYDIDETAFHPEVSNPALFEWRRKNIENYLLVPDAWMRALSKELGELFTVPLRPIVDDFFTEQNLTLPNGRTWRDVTANVFEVVDGKRILFENTDSLFHRLSARTSKLSDLRDRVAGAMTASEIHADVFAVFEKMKAAIYGDNSATI